MGPPPAAELRPHPRPRVRSRGRTSAASSTARRWRGESRRRVAVSRRRAGLPEKDAASVLAALSALGPFPEPERDRSRLEPFLARDKKATARGLAAILLERIGSARVDETRDARRVAGRGGYNVAIVSGRSGRRRIRLFVLLSGALVLASLVPLVVAEAVLIRRNQRTLETLEEKYLTRSSAAIADHIAAYYAAAAQQLTKAGDAIRLAIVLTGKDPFASTDGPEILGSVLAGQTQLAAIRGRQPRGPRKLRRRGRQRVRHRLRVPEGLRVRPRRRPLRGQPLRRRQPRDRRRPRSTRPRREGQPGRRGRGARLLAADPAGVRGRSPARGARHARRSEGQDPLPARVRGQGAGPPVEPRGGLRPLPGAADAFGVERHGRRPGVDRAGRRSSPGACSSSATATSLSPRSTAWCGTPSSGARSASPARSPSAPLRPPPVPADRPARGVHPRRGGREIRRDRRGGGNRGDRRPLRELQRDEHVDPRRVREGPESRPREPGALPVLDPRARRRDRRQGSLHPRPLGAGRALRLRDRAGDGPAHRRGAQGAPLGSSPRRRQDRRGRPHHPQAHGADGRGVRAHEGAPGQGRRDHGDNSRSSPISSPA